jgi:hypothetical protein
MSESESGRPPEVEMYGSPLPDIVSEPWDHPGMDAMRPAPGERNQGYEDWLAWRASPEYRTLTRGKQRQTWLDRLLRRR